MGVQFIRQITRQPPPPEIFIFLTKCRHSVNMMLRREHLVTIAIRVMELPGVSEGTDPPEVCRQIKERGQGAL